MDVLKKIDYAQNIANIVKIISEKLNTAFQKMVLVL